MENTPGVKLAKLNVDENDRTADRLKVSAIPAVFAFYKGEVLSDFVGLLPEDKIKIWVENVAAAKEELAASKRTD